MDQGDPPRHGEGDHPKDGGGALSVITGPRDTLKRARKLRSEMSLPERMLWRLLRGRPDGFKFRRQHPAGIYILDFYCPAVRQGIAVDGRTHDGEHATQTEEAGSDFLKSQPNHNPP